MNPNKVYSVTFTSWTDVSTEDATKNINTKYYTYLMIHDEGFTVLGHWLTHIQLELL